LEIKAPYVPPIVNPKPPEEPKTNWLPIAAGAIIALVAVAGIGAFVVSRRKSRAPPGPTADEKAEMERKKALMPALYGAEGAAGATTTAGVSGGIVERDLGGGAAAGYVPPAATTSPSGARTMNCPKCGNEVEADAEYCYTCGERWGKDAGKKADADLYKPAEAPAAPVEYQQPAPPVEEAPVYQPEPAPEPIEEAPAVPVEAPAPPPRQGDELDDILGQLQSINAPAPAPPPARHPPAHPAQARPPAQPAQARPPAQPVRHVEQPRQPQGPPAGPPAQPVQPGAHASATAQGGTGKACPKCGNEMSRLVELPGAQNEQLKKLNAKGQHAFQCRSCGHFEISKWP
jgi:predicted nucleic-acid-binding Zn-ribbon protein